MGLTQRFAVLQPPVVITASPPNAIRSGMVGSAFGVGSPKDCCKQRHRPPRALRVHKSVEVVAVCPPTAPLTSAR